MIDSVQIVQNHFIFWSHKYQFLPRVTGQYEEVCYLFSYTVLSNIDVDNLITGIPSAYFQGKDPNDKLVQQYEVIAHFHIAVQAEFLRSKVNMETDLTTLFLTLYHFSSSGGT